MHALGRSFEALQDEAGRFVRSRELRMLDVVTAPRLRKPVLDLLMAQEHGATNRSPFVLFEQPFTARKPGWLERAEDARKQHQLRLERMREVGEHLEPLPELPRSGDPLSRFAVQLGQLLQARPAGTEGLVVILAPSLVEAGPTWSDGLRRLLLAKGLHEVRWVVVELDESGADDVLALLGDRAKKVEHMSGAQGEQLALQALISSLASGVEGPPGARPSVEPPPRRDRPPPEPPDPEVGKRRLVANEILSSMLAMVTRQPARAVEHQRRARDLCLEPGPNADAATMELMLGAHLVAAGQPKAAEQSYARVIEIADAAKLPEQAAAGQFALGTTRWVQRNQHGALVAYAEGVVAAEQGGAKMLAIEGCRLTGQVAMSLGMDAQAIAFWGRAVRLAEDGADPPSLGCASVCARNLADLCERRGLRAQADQMRAKAEALATSSVSAPVEEPEVEPPAMPSAPPEVAAEEREEPPAIQPRPLEAGGESPVEAPAIQRTPAPLEPPAIEPPELEELEPPQVEPQPEAPWSDILPGTERLPLMEPTLPVEPERAPEPAFEPDVTAAWDPQQLPSRIPSTTAPLGAPTTQRLSPVAAGSIFGMHQGGTDVLTLQDVAALHWGGANVERSTEIPHWTDAQQAILRKTTLDMLDETTTSLLDPEEMAALLGEAPLWRPPEAPVVEQTVPISSDDAAPPQPSKVEGSDGFSPEQIARLRSLRRGPGGDGKAGE